MVRARRRGDAHFFDFGRRGGAALQLQLRLHRMADHASDAGSRSSRSPRLRRGQEVLRGGAPAALPPILRRTARSRTRSAGGAVSKLRRRSPSSALLVVLRSVVVAGRAVSRPIWSI